MADIARHRPRSEKAKPLPLIHGEPGQVNTDALIGSKPHYGGAETLRTAKIEGRNRIGQEGESLVC